MPWGPALGGFDQQPPPPVGLTPAKWNSFPSAIAMWDSPSSSSPAFGSCHNFILNFDTSSHFQAKPNKRLICICMALKAEMSAQLMMPLSARTPDTALGGISASAAPQTPVCIFSTAATLPTLRATLSSNYFVKIIRNEPNQMLEN